MRAARPLNWRWHWRRLLADCGTLALPVPSERLLLDEVHAVAPDDAVVKITLTRGEATRGYAPAAEPRTTRIVASFPPAAYPASHRDGVRVRRCELVLSRQPRLAGAKTLNRLENVLARAEWSDAGIAEGLLADADANVIEGTMSNVFVVQGGKVATPALSRSGVVGAQRERARELLQSRGIDCSEREIGWDALRAADEVFLTNSLIGIWPVIGFEDRTWTAGPVARTLQAAIEDDAARA